MFDIGWSEMALILLVALVVIGPRDLPRVARTMGRWVAKGRAMAREFQGALEDMAREAELDKVKSEIEKAGRTNLGKAVENTIDPTGELGKAFDPAAKSGPPPARPAAPAGNAGTGNGAAIQAKAEPAKPATGSEPSAAAAKPVSSAVATEPKPQPAAATRRPRAKAAKPEPSANPGKPVNSVVAEPQAEAAAVTRRPRAKAPARASVPTDPS
jgi:sec-independent protein translocase protein TatB